MGLFLLPTTCPMIGNTRRSFSDHHNIKHHHQNNNNNNNNRAWKDSSSMVVPCFRRKDNAMKSVTLLAATLPHKGSASTNHSDKKKKKTKTESLKSKTSSSKLSTPRKKQKSMLKTYPHHHHSTLSKLASFKSHDTTSTSTTTTHLHQKQVSSISSSLSPPPPSLPLSTSSSSSTNTRTSLGQVIQEFTNYSSPQLLLNLTKTYIWLPTDDLNNNNDNNSSKSLPSSSSSLSLIHTHYKRRRNASLLLEKLASCEYKWSLDHNYYFIGTDELLCRVILAAAIPFHYNTSSSSTSVLQQQQQQQQHDMAIVVHSSLLGLHSIIGKMTLFPIPISYLKNTSSTTSSSSSVFLHSFLYGISLLIQQAEFFTFHYTLQQVVEIRWAIRGILIRLFTIHEIDGMNLIHLILNHHYDYDDDDDPSTTTTTHHHHDKKDNKSNKEKKKKKKKMIHFNKNEMKNRGLLLAQCIPQLEKRVSKLPFDILPCGIDWDIITLQSNNYNNNNNNNNNNVKNPTRILHSTEIIPSSSSTITSTTTTTLLHQLQNQIQFQFENIITLSGNSVVERRGTAWVTEKGIGSLAYSGKLMEPKELPMIVQMTMRHVEEAMFQNYYYHPTLLNNDDDDDDDDDEVVVVEEEEDITFTAGQVCWEEMGTFFNCALCNLYPTGQSACKFHTDPEHGTYWDRLTCVVSAGEERKFAFRPIPGKNAWSQWNIIINEVMDNNNKGQTSSLRKINPVKEWDPTWNSDKEFMPACIHLFPGDIVLMKGSCNDMFHHSVYPASPSTDGSVRVSLVLKRALDRNDRRGHGKAL